MQCHSSSKLLREVARAKGKCEEFAIVYVSACLALGYEARIVVARQFYLGPLHGFHALESRL
jgi:transglutaminase-like putative cysteine protease